MKLYDHAPAFTSDKRPARGVAEDLSRVSSAGMPAGTLVLPLTNSEQHLPLLIGGEGEQPIVRSSLDYYS